MVEPTLTSCPNFGDHLIATLSSDDIIALIDRILAKASFPFTVESLREHRSEAKSGKLHLYDRQYIYKLAKRLKVIAVETGPPKADAAQQQQKQEQRHWKEREAKSKARNSSMDREEALKILGLGKNPSRDEVKAQHRNLIQRLHPDGGGSDHFAAQVNSARDLLLQELSEP
jgi:hypothetical protein